MSTRYVWEKYNYESVWAEKTFICLSSITVTIYDAYMSAGPQAVWECGTNGSFSESSERYLISGMSVRTGTSFIDALTYPYLALSTSVPDGTATIFGKTHVARLFMLQYNGSATQYWKIKIDAHNGTYSTYRIGIATSKDSNAPWGACNVFCMALEDQKTTKFGQVSSDSEETYPKDGIKSDVYYYYAGSDSIDPVSISYSQTNPKGGDSITVTVNPTSPAYGGTIYYQYQYSTDGGSTWTNSGNRTTSRTKTFTLQKGPTKFTARVLASDNYGFTSTDYVTGSTLKVTNNIAPVSISYSNTKPKGGERITVTVTNPSGITWPLTYGYYCSYNNSAWINDGTSTSNTRVFIIPRGSKYFRVRVYAEDDYGNNSNFVYGTNLTVINIQAYIGVNGVARKVTKVYIGDVNGRAREVTAGYIGINDKARSWY